jgi:hypothetical protein
MAHRAVRRVWVQNVAVGVRVLETRLDVAAATGLGPDQKAAAEGVRKLLKKAEDAACGIDPKANRLGNWWNGALACAAYQNLHAAKAQMADVYDDDEIAAEIPLAIARSQMSLHRDDPRRLEAFAFDNRSLTQQRALLRRAIEDGYDAMDRQHDRLRSFRNIILLLALFIALLTATTIVVVSQTPTMLPLCFPADGLPDGDPLLNCPTGSNVPAPSGDDILVVSLLGLLGGALAAAVSLRNLRGTSTPYDLPVALATLKVPLGAFTAFLGLVAIKGDFVPGLSALDSQEQILAYALLLGFGQQVFTNSLDKKAQTLLNGVTSKDAATTPVHGPTPHPPPPQSRGPRPPSNTVPSPVPSPRSGDPSLTEASPNGSAASTNGSGPKIEDVASPPQPLEPVDSMEEDEPAYQPPPPDIDEDVPQDDGSPTLPGVPVEDHR